MSRFNEETNISSKLGRALAKIQQEVQDNQQIRLVEIQDEMNELAQLKDLEEYNLSDKDKRDFLYKVKPQLRTIGKMIDAGMTSVQIAQALTISHACLTRLRNEIPELEEVFYIGKLNKIEMAEESMFRLAQQDVVQEEVITKDGDVITVNKVREADFRAVKFVLERLKKEEYGDQIEVVHSAGLSHDMETLLAELPAEVLAEILNKESAIDITDDVEVTERDD